MRCVCFICVEKLLYNFNKFAHPQLHYSTLTPLSNYLKTHSTDPTFWQYHQAGKTRRLLHDCSTTLTYSLDFCCSSLEWWYITTLSSVHSWSDTTVCQLVSLSLMTACWSITLQVSYTLIAVVVLLVGHRTCNSQVAGSSPGRAPPHSGLGQATYTCVPLSPNSIIIIIIIIIIIEIVHEVQI